MQEHFSAGAWMARSPENEGQFPLDRTPEMQEQFPARARKAGTPKNEGAISGARLDGSTS
jgi:hypothetical protein